MAHALDTHREPRARRLDPSRSSAQEPSARSRKSGPTIDDFDVSLSAPPVQLKRLDSALVRVRRAVVPGWGDDAFVQQRAKDPRREEDAAAVHAHAARGTAGGGGALPHLGRIQAAFGGHDVTGVKAHLGAQAAEACEGMGARAFASGEDVAFREAPSLHTAAHEAAHVVQQRAGVALSSGVGHVGDAYERHADAVADRVVRGESAEGLLDRMAGRGGATSAGAVQREAAPEDETEEKEPAPADSKAADDEAGGDDAAVEEEGEVQEMDFSEDDEEIEAQEDYEEQKGPEEAGAAAKEAGRGEGPPVPATSEAKGGKKKSRDAKGKHGGSVGVDRDKGTVAVKYEYARSLGKHEIPPAPIPVGPFQVQATLECGFKLGAAYEVTVAPNAPKAPKNGQAGTLSGDITGTVGLELSLGLPKKLEAMGVTGKIYGTFSISVGITATGSLVWGGALASSEAAVSLADVPLKADLKLGWAVEDPTGTIDVGNEFTLAAMEIGKIAGLGYLSAGHPDATKKGGKPGWSTPRFVLNPALKELIYGTDDVNAAIQKTNQDLSEVGAKTRELMAGEGLPEQFAQNAAALYVSAGEQSSDYLDELDRGKNIANRAKELYDCELIDLEKAGVPKREAQRVAAMGRRWLLRPERRFIIPPGEWKPSESRPILEQQYRDARIEAAGDKGPWLK